MGARVSDIVLLELRRWCREACTAIPGAPACLLVPNPAGLGGLIDELLALRARTPEYGPSVLVDTFRELNLDKVKVELLRAAADRLRGLGDQDDLVLQIDEILDKQEAERHQPVRKARQGPGSHLVVWNAPQYEIVCAVAGCGCRGASHR